MSSSQSLDEYLNNKTGNPAEVHPSHPLLVSQCGLCVVSLQKFGYSAVKLQMMSLASHRTLYQMFLLEIRSLVSRMWEHERRQAQLDSIAAWRAGRQEGGKGVDIVTL